MNDDGRSFPWRGEGRVEGALGVLGALAIASGVLLATSFHQGSYSVFNHFISELGWLKHSKMAWPFGACLFLGGLLCAPAVWRTGMSLGTRCGMAGAALGAFAALSGAAVGLVPMDWIVPHTVVAFMYFSGWLLASLLFAASLLRGREDKAGRALGLLCLASSLASLAFIAVAAYVGAQLVPSGDLKLFLSVLESYQRPDYWPVAIMEWLVLASSGAWCAGCSLLLLSGKLLRASPPSGELVAPAEDVL